jgi:hypothetical protein
MFKLQPNPTFSSKVKLSVPGNEAPQTVTITFKHLSRPQIKSYFTALEGKTDAEALGEIVTDWAGIDAKYSPENLQELLENYPTAAEELFSAYRRELMESRAKN